MKKRELISIFFLLTLILIIIMDSALFLPNEILIIADLGIQIDAIGIIVEVGDEVLEDRKITLGDVPALLDGLKQYKTIMKGFQDAKKAGEELKELDAKEAQELGQYVFAKIIAPIFD